MSKEKQQEATHVAIPVELFRTMRISMENAVFPNQSFGQVAKMLGEIDKNVRGVNLNEAPRTERNEVMNPQAEEETPRGSKK